MANVNFPVAGFAPAATRNNKFPRITLSTAETGYIINAAWAPGARFKMSLVPSGTTMLYHSVAGQSQTDGQPVAAGGVLTLIVQHGDILYISGLGAGTLDCIQVDN